MIAAGTYWHPGNLGRHITKWSVAGASEVRFVCVAIAGTEGVAVRPVFDVSIEAMLSGLWGDFATGIETSARGFYVTDWEPVNEDAQVIGDVYVGIIIEVAAEIDDADLILGLAEVQVR